MSRYNKTPKAVLEVTKNITKKGRLKGRNKKETRALRGMCPHHKLNKRGHIKPTLVSNEKGYCFCTLCKSRVRTKFYTNEEVIEIVGAMEELNSQAKYAAVAINAGNETNDFFATTGIIMANYVKTYKRVRNIAQQQSKHKKKKNRYGNGSNAYGSWGKASRRR